MLHAEHFEQLGRALLDLAPVAAAYITRYADVFQRRELGQQMVELENEADFRIAEARELPVRKGVHRLSVDLDLARARAAQRA